LNTPILFTIESIVSKRSGCDTRTGLLPQKILIIDPELIQWDRHRRTIPPKKRRTGIVNLAIIVELISRNSEQRWGVSPKSSRKKALRKTSNEGPVGKSHQEKNGS
jgi:hypothetical protein